MNTSEYSNLESCQYLTAKPITNKPGENYIVATDDNNLISQYSKPFHNEGYIVEIIDLIHPENSTVSFDVLHQIQSVRDAKWFANQLKVPWLRDDPYWEIQAADLISALIRALKTTHPNAYISTLVKLLDSLYLGMVRNGTVPADIESMLAEISAADPQNDLLCDIEMLLTLPRKTLIAVCKHGSRILHHYFGFIGNTVTQEIPEFNSRSLLGKKTVLFLKVDSAFAELQNCAAITFKLIAKSLFDYLRENVVFTLPVNTNFICDPALFQSTHHIHGDWTLPHLGVSLIFSVTDNKYDGIAKILDKALG